MDKKEEILGENLQDLPTVEPGITAIPVSDDEDEQETDGNNGHLESAVQPANGALTGDPVAGTSPAIWSQQEAEPVCSDISSKGEGEEEPAVNPQTLEVEPDAVSDVDDSLPVPEQTNVIDEISIAHEMNHYMKVNSINWVELSDREEMWAVCDAISAAHSGLPDSLLKEAFHCLLQGHLNKTPKQKHSNSYLRIHLEGLLRIWNVEMQTEKATNRVTKFIAAPAAYSPPLVKRRRGNGQRKRAIKALMGVGEILQQAQLKFCTEEGELDVDEDEHGIISIGGQELSFESWAQLNKISQADIVHSSVVPPKQKRQRPQPKKFSENHMQMQEIEEQKKMTLPKPEKDEGEISESESSSCSSSSSEGEGQGDREAAKGRRRKRRIKERRKTPASVSNMNQMFAKFYQYRFQIAQNLSLQQKASFLDLIKQSNGGISAARQQQQMAQFMTSFLGSSSSMK